VFFIVKFNSRLYAATRPTVLAVQAGDVRTALRTAPSMGLQASQLAQDALGRAHGAIISGNDQLYFQMAQIAQAFVNAASELVQAARSDGTYDPVQYQAGARSLAYAVSKLG
jgi:hypothetical protein